MVPALCQHGNRGMAEVVRHGDSASDKPCHTKYSCIVQLAFREGFTVKPLLLQIASPWLEPLLWRGVAWRGVLGSSD